MFRIFALVTEWGRQSIPNTAIWDFTFKVHTYNSYVHIVGANQGQTFLPTFIILIQ